MLRNTAGRLRYVAKVAKVAKCFQILRNYETVKKLSGIVRKLRRKSMSRMNLEKSFYDKIKLFETQFPAMKSDSLDRESALAVKKWVKKKSEK